MGQLFILDGRHRPPLATYPGTHAGHMCRFTKKQRIPLFGLAPGGVYPATGVDRRGALLPHLFTLTTPQVRRFGGMFSVALSVSSRPPGVTWRPALWSPDFPLP